MIFDLSTLVHTHIFKNFLVLIILYCLKTAIHLTFNLFVCLWKTNIFFTVYTCFKETVFFNFSYKLFHKYFSVLQSTCHQFRQGVSKKISLNSLYVIVHNIRFFWKGLCFNYLISTLWLEFYSGWVINIANISVT